MEKAATGHKYSLLYPPPMPVPVPIVPVPVGMPLGMGIMEDTYSSHDGHGVKPKRFSAQHAQIARGKYFIFYHFELI
jgi:hypothetical protein